MLEKMIVLFLDVIMKDLPFDTFVIGHALRKIMSLEKYYNISYWHHECVICCILLRLKLSINKKLIIKEIHVRLYLTRSRLCCKISKISFKKVFVRHPQ